MSLLISYINWQSCIKSFCASVLQDTFSVLTQNIAALLFHFLLVFNVFMLLCHSVFILYYPPGNPILRDSWFTEALYYNVDTFTHTQLYLHTTSPPHPPVFIVQLTSQTHIFLIKGCFQNHYYPIWLLRSLPSLFCAHCSLLCRC